MDFKNYIQVAGIIDALEAEMLIKSGVKYLGFPLRLPVNKEDLTEEEASEIISSLQPPINSVIISYSKSAEEAIELCRGLNSNIIQLHGDIDVDEIKKIKQQNIIVIKSLVIEDDNEKELIDLVDKMEYTVDAFITDTYDPVSGASGATGKVHDWEISKRLTRLSPKPLILAGGLTPGNVYNAILRVGCAGVDVHTGVENPTGRKDTKLIRQFIKEAEKAFDEIEN